MQKNENALIVPENMNEVNNDFFDKLEKMEDTNMLPTDAEYLEFSEGEIHNLIFTGFEDATFGEETKEASTFQGKNGFRFINANSVIVNAMKRLSAPCPVRIICTGEMKSAKGNKYKTFKIFTL